jgi:hypothetical protein
MSADEKRAKLKQAMDASKDAAETQAIQLAGRIREHETEIATLKRLLADATKPVTGAESSAVREATLARDTAFAQLEVAQQECAALRACCGITTDDSVTLTPAAKQLVDELQKLAPEERLKRFEQHRSGSVAAPVGGLTAELSKREAEITQLKELLHDTTAGSKKQIATLQRMLADAGVGATAEADNKSLRDAQETRDAALAQLDAVKAEAAALHRCLDQAGVPSEKRGEVAELAAKSKEVAKKATAKEESVLSAKEAEISKLRKKVKELQKVERKTDVDLLTSVQQSRDQARNEVEVLSEEVIRAQWPNQHAQHRKAIAGAHNPH